ncbi:acyltransferase family protein [Methylobacillus sp.]|uniref:acyltransferase family protein n=1 Tax=Methylobacillus sp. TaxID=56818 RepID=UPI0012CF13C5|nr:acyltransferase family protein [Methylobacillus sp.]MPS48372.1 acyltransferase [Methylobacillus sp.]
MSVVKPNLFRIVFLDALRGMAAFSVLIYHLQNYFINSSHKAEYETSVVSFSKLLLNNINLGLFGVVLFFLISGFIIPQTLNSRTTVFKFSINRFFRLYPAFWASILITIIVGPMVGAGEFSGIQILANATMVPKIFGQDLINGIYWTLFVELIFYVICAAMFVGKLLDNVKAVGVIALALALVSPMSILLNLNGLRMFHFYS